ncbi:hypothetical protein Val02_44210 [Virgisporangium aliadipatigenens]|uniref:SGNH hydrolase-type esterase domain-containing protein n=1 Tax=Virgisporangium aliadipatigenens TaxID=741659 RepID=A0A8J3YPA5_9ACTN|nr:hypothetical protein Val02_44210 [Virgisporangium aliadipatigenens]
MALLVAATVVVPGPGKADAATAFPALRIMPMGDSITYGVGSSTSSSYRADLWNLLRGEFAVDYVGAQRSGQLPDADHEGYSGRVITEVAGYAASAVPRYRPNVITLHVGTNDMNRNVNVADAPARLGGLIDQLLAAAPDATILVATLVPANDPAVQARIDAYNARIPGVVEQRRAAGKHVGLVDMSALTTADLIDTLHPNDAGYRKMAAAFHDGVLRAVFAGWVGSPVPDSVRCAAKLGWNSRGRVASGAAPGAKVRFADYNGDGRDDYLVLDPATGAVDAWQNNGGDGSGGWISLGRVASGAAPGDRVRFADFDGDRRDDYWVLDPANGAVQVWRNTTSGWVSLGQVASGAAPGDRVRFADWDGDGRDDYWVVEPTSGAVQVWRNTGSGWAALGQVASGAAPADRVRFADLNCDRRDDYLVLDPSSGSVGAWLNPTWTNRGRVASGAAPGDRVRFADFDGDGRDDYLVVDPTTGALDLWLNSGGD